MHLPPYAIFSVFPQLLLFVLGVWFEMLISSALAVWSIVRSGSDSTILEYMFAASGRCCERRLALICMATANFCSMFLLVAAADD